MPLDANGIYLYDETENETTMSDLLNLLGGSTSDKVAVIEAARTSGDAALDARLDIIEATSGSNLTVTNATADHCRVDVDGLGRVTFRGEIWSVTAGVICTLPSGYRPPKRVEIMAHAFGANAYTRRLGLAVATDGTVTALTPDGTALTSSPGYTWNVSWRLS